MVEGYFTMVRRDIHGGRLLYPGKAGYTWWKVTLPW